METTNGFGIHHHSGTSLPQFYKPPSNLGHRETYLNEYTGLVVRVGCEGLRLLGRNGGVALDEDSHDSTSSFNSKGKRSDIQQQQVLNIFRFVSR